MPTIEKVKLYDPRGQELDLSRKAAAMSNPEPDFFSSILGDNSTRDIERKPYQLHWIVYACARAIAWNLRRLPRQLLGEDDKVVKNDEVMKVLRKPNPFMTSYTFWEAVVLYSLLPAREGYGRGMKGGQCFLICDSGKEDPHVDLAAGQIPLVIYPYNDEFVSPEFDGNRKFIGWKLDLREQGLVEHYKPHEIIRIYNFNPYDWLRGLSMYEPAQRAIVNDIKADIWNTRTFENDAIPSGILSSDQEIDDKQATELSNRWMQKQGGPGNARRIAVLGKGSKFQTVAVTQKDMEFTEQKTRIVDETLAVFGLNKIAIGNYEKINYATIVEGRKMLWEDTYLPIDESIMEQVNSQWVVNIDPRNPIRLAANTSGIRVLKKDYSKSVEAAKKMVDTGVPAAVAYRINEVPLTEDDLAAAPWLNEKPTPSNPFGVNPPAPTEPEPKAGTKSAKTPYTVEMLDKISADYIEKVLQPGENLFHAKLVRYFLDERNQLQDKVDAWLKKRQTEKSGDVPDESDFRLDQAAEDAKLVDKIYRPMVIDQVRREALRLKQELGTLEVFGVTDELILGYVEKRAEGLRAINTTTIEMYREKIIEAIAEGCREVYNPNQFAKAIKEAIADTGEIRKNQARTIARTETGIISSAARYDAFLAEGVEQHQWVSAHDEKVRHTHAEEDGHVVNVGEPFPTTGLIHPLDEDGEPEEIINCRCTTIAFRGE